MAAPDRSAHAEARRLDPVLHTLHLSVEQNVQLCFFGKTLLKKNQVNRNFMCQLRTQREMGNRLSIGDFQTANEGADSRLSRLGQHASTSLLQDNFVTWMRESIALNMRQPRSLAAALGMQPKPVKTVLEYTALMQAEVVSSQLGTFFPALKSSESAPMAWSHLACSCLAWFDHCDSCDLCESRSDPKKQNTRVPFRHQSLSLGSPQP
jgi:hypothetical protein